MFAEQPLVGASDFAMHFAAEKAGTIATLAAWTKADEPWVEFEAFRNATIDRHVADIARGFDLLIGCSDLPAAGLTLSLARELGRPAIVASVQGRSGWCAFVPGAEICEDCFEAPALDGGGLYYPLLEVAATWIATAAIEHVMGSGLNKAFLESFDATRSPWMRDTRELRPRSTCEKCSKQV